MVEGSRLVFKAKCEECGRIFDLTAEVESGDWFYGHDCEGNGQDG